MERLVALLGLGVLVGVSYLFSHNRPAIRWQPVLWGIGLQLIFAVLILRTSVGLGFFQFLGDQVTRLLNFSDAGAAFVFGEKFQEIFFAFKVLPTIIFFSALISLLYHYNILQRVVHWIALLMMRTMKTSGAESLSAAGNIFVGQTEAPLMIKPYVATLTLSELHAVMTGGFATIAGGVLAAYVSFGVPPEHLIAASVMSAPAGLAISKLMYPETEESQTGGTAQVLVEPTSVNAIDAITSGALDGMKLALNITAMLVAFLGLVAMLNALLGWLGSLVGWVGLSLESLLAYPLAPLAWLMGIPWADCAHVGVLLGKKTILNEFIAYLDLKALMENQTISERGMIITTYALCGFANIGSIGIQIGGIGGIAPERQRDLAQLGVRAMIAGNIACFMTACIAGMLI